MTDPLTTFPAFAQAVQVRLEQGAVAYAADPAAERPLADLAAELTQEVEDLAGWAACLWPRLRALQGRLATLDAPPTTDPFRAGVQIDPETLAEIVVLAHQMGLPPSAVVRTALRALTVELQAAQGKRRRSLPPASPDQPNTPKVTES